jgi:hypothetical protein
MNPHSFAGTMLAALLASSACAEQIAQAVPS